MLHGLRIIPAPWMVRTRRVETRVLGGYRNRWLIRQLVDIEEPDPSMIRAPHPHGGFAIYMHPALIERLRRMTAESL